MRGVQGVTHDPDLGKPVLSHKLLGTTFLRFNVMHVIKAMNSAHLQGPPPLLIHSYQSQNGHHSGSDPQACLLRPPSL
jgi:hypothetical protein